jgi:topoisomerase-4 subunit A
MTKRIAPSAPGGGGGNIEPVELKEALEERYLSYALSTIMGRALPDARDGLKPVHRRILHAMRILRLDPGTGFKKSARVVGDVIGKFHPHGDQSVYDALVRLAQDFAQRYPLVDGQGNFGNVDGDNAAAMRYTEARMTDVARLLLEGIDEDAVDMRLTYDGEEQEPIVLPGAFPNLLANGSTGIAVGMATSIPPHNAAELCDAALFLIEKPRAQPREVLKFVKGPDFPTGGIIVDDKATIREAYNTGRGSFRVRARWTQENTGNGTWVVVVTEIPYSVPKSRLIEKIAELLTDKKLPLLADIRDESTEDVRIVLEPRSRSVDPVLMMEQLFKLTELESRFPLNMNVLMGGLTPRVVSLAEAIKEWLDHRRVVLIRRSKNRLGIIDHRLEVLGGYLIAYLNLDEVIKIIRTQDEPKPVLMKRFKLSDVQADAILNMRLRNLRKLEEMEIRGENAELKKEKAGLEKLLKSPAGQWNTISDQIKEVKELFGPKRKSESAAPASRPRRKSMKPRLRNRC